MARLVPKQFFFHFKGKDKLEELKNHESSEIVRLASRLLDEDSSSGKYSVNTECIEKGVSYDPCQNLIDIDVCVTKKFPHVQIVKVS